MDLNQRGPETKAYMPEKQTFIYLFIEIDEFSYQHIHVEKQIFYWFVIYAMQSKVRFLP